MISSFVFKLSRCCNGSWSGDICNQHSEWKHEFMADLGYTVSSVHPGLYSMTLSPKRRQKQIKMFISEIFLSF